MCVIATVRFWLAVVTCSICAFAVITIAPIASAVLAYLTDSAIPIDSALSITAQLLRESLVQGVFADPFSALVSLAIGINIPLLVIFFRRYRPGLPVRGLSASALGLIASIFGIGCAACGAIFFGAFSATAGGALLAIPYAGTSIGYVGIVLLLTSSAYLAHEIARMK